MSDLNSVREDLDQAVATLDDLRVAMRDGQNVDLDAFNLMVAQTCKAAVELPQADAPKVRGQLERLLHGLNEVKADIEAEQAAIDARLTEIGAAVDVDDAEVVDAAAAGHGDSANGTVNSGGRDTPPDD